MVRARSNSLVDNTLGAWLENRVDNHVGGVNA